MPLESTTFISGLVSTNPAGTDQKAQGDDHIRLLKEVLKATFPNADRAIKTGEIGGAVSAKSAGFTVVAADAGSFFDCSGTFTIALSTAASLGANFGFRVQNFGAGLITIDPAGGELINGAATYAVAIGDSVFVICSGTAWFTQATGVATNRSHNWEANQFFNQGIGGVHIGNPLSFAFGQFEHRFNSAEAGAFNWVRSRGVGVAGQNNDALFQHQFIGNDAAGNITAYAALIPKIIVAADGSETAQLDIAAKGVGTYTGQLTIGGGTGTGGVTVGNAIGGALAFGILNSQHYYHNGVNVVPAGHIEGLVTSNNGSDPGNDIDIGTGQCCSGDFGQMMALLSSLTKRLDANWVVGTNQGGLDTGAVGDGWYHMWLIRRPDTGVTDVLFSLSATAPTMPANYTQKRLFWSIFRTSGAIKLYTQVRNHCIWAAAAIDVANDSVSTTAELKTVTAPPLLGTIARMRCSNNTAGATREVIVSSLLEPDVAPDELTGQGGDSITNTNIGLNYFNKDVLLTTAGQVRVRATAATDINIMTYEFIHARGRQ